MMCRGPLFRGLIVVSKSYHLTWGVSTKSPRGMAEGAASLVGLADLPAPTAEIAVSAGNAVELSARMPVAVREDQLLRLLEMMSPNSSHFSPLKRIKRNCLIGAKSVAEVLMLMPGSSVSGT